MYSANSSPTVRFAPSTSASWPSRARRFIPPNTSTKARPGPISRSREYLAVSSGLRDSTARFRISCASTALCSSHCVSVTGVRLSVPSGSRFGTRMFANIGRDAAPPPQPFAVWLYTSRLSCRTTVAEISSFASSSSSALSVSPLDNCSYSATISAMVFCCSDGVASSLLVRFV